MWLVRILVVVMSIVLLHSEAFSESGSLFEMRPASRQPWQGYLAYPTKAGEPTLYLSALPILTEADVLSADTTETGQVLLTFHDNAAKTFSDFTAQNIGKPLAILVSGKVITAPTIADQLGGRQANINFGSKEKAQDFIAKLGGFLGGRPITKGASGGKAASEIQDL